MIDVTVVTALVRVLSAAHYVMMVVLEHVVEVVVVLVEIALEHVPTVVLVPPVQEWTL